jgi:hypothetical protein
MQKKFAKFFLYTNAHVANQYQFLFVEESGVFKNHCPKI